MAIWLSSRSSAAAFTLVCALVACGESTTTDDLARRHKDAGVRLDAPVTIADAPAPSPDAHVVTDAHVADAHVADAQVAHDAATLPDAGTVAGGTVSCYSQGDPTNTCTLPVHCCFDNYTSAHDGACSTGTCTYGTITCDGPEDCNTGELCCAHAIRDPDLGTTGYTIACQTGSCGNDSLNVEICHPATGCSSGTCVTAYLHDNDLPRTLDVCQ